ncbi:MAG: hypothetical protein IKO56_02280 [Alphaproteobacteria bacterium]|nr:hypothetical protein [Alphaproteobacteria bacterium]
MKKEQKTSKPNKRLEKAMSSYFDICNYVGIEDSMDKKKKVRILLSAGEKTMGEINETLDGIINEDYSEVFEMLNIPISKPQYKEFVSIMGKIKMDAFSEKNREKYEEQVKQKMFDQCLREKFLDSVINQFEDVVPVPDWNKNISVNVVTSDDTDFNNVLQRSIDKYVEVKNVKENLLNKYGEAFEYITELKYSKKDYKTLVEWQYFCGGIPNENSAPKMFSVFYKFNQLFRLGLEFYKDATQDLLDEMGLAIEENEPMPRGEHFPWWTKEMIDRYCPTVKDDYYDWLNEK